MRYADDIKIYGEVDTLDQMGRLRYTVKKSESWCASLDLILSADKFVVMHFEA